MLVIRGYLLDRRALLDGSTSVVGSSRRVKKPRINRACYLPCLQQASRVLIASQPRYKIGTERAYTFRLQPNSQIDGLTDGRYANHGAGF